MGFGPEQLSIPNNFRIPVSSFGMYGGHASIRIRYDSQSLDVLYNKGGDAPGNNIEFLQGEPCKWIKNQLLSFLFCIT